MKTSFVLLEILVFVSLWHNSHGKFWNGHHNPNQNNNNENTKSHPRRRLTELTEETVEVDAATGTVKSDDTNCDGQLAQALVEANDKEFQAKQERDQAIKDRAVATEELRQLRSSLKTFNDTIEKLEAEVKSLRRDHQDPDVLAESEESMIELKELLRTKDDTIAMLKAEIEAYQEQKQQQKELETKLAELIADAKAKEVEYQNQSDSQRKVAEQLLETTREEAKRVLIENVATIKEQMKEAEKKFKTALAEKDEVIKQVKAQNERFSTLNQEMLETKQAQEKEIEQWRATFDNRGYCNMTHINEDIKDLAMVIYMHSSQGASVAASKALEMASVGVAKGYEASLVAAAHLQTHGLKLGSQLLVYTQAGFKKSMAIFKDQFNVLWPKIQPHYDQHAAPLVNKFLQWKSNNVDPTLTSAQKEYLAIKTKQIDPRVKVFEAESKKLFAKMVELYGTHCTESYKLAHKLSKEYGYLEQFQSVGPFVKQSCDNAEVSVTMLLRTMVILALLPFAGRIFGFGWAILRLLVNIVLTVTFLRFFLPRGSTTGTSTSKPVKEQPVPFKGKSPDSAKKRSPRRR